MFDSFFKKKNKIIEIDDSGNIKNSGKKTKWLIYIIMVAILILAFSGGSNEKGKTKKTDSAPTPNNEQYVLNTENELEEVLKTIKGAGRVKVKINVSEYGEKVLAVDTKKNIATESDNEKKKQESSEEKTAIICGTGSEEKPVVLKEMLPAPSGILVVAEGGGAESVRLDIYEAVKALYGLSGHRIKVVQGHFK